MADLRGMDKGAMAPSPLELGHNKFPERQSGASRMQKNILAPPRNPLGTTYIAPPCPLAGGEEVGCSLPKNSTTFSGFAPLGLGPDPCTA